MSSGAGVASWANAVRPLVILFTAINLIVTWIFKANVDGYLKQCAYYDILLGTKSLKLLSEAPDLWAELGNNAATNRGMKYLTDTGAGTVDIEGRTCAEAWTLINNQWDDRINAYALPFAHTMYPKLTEAAAGAKLAADVPVVVTRSHYFADDVIEGAVAIGPGLQQRAGWHPQPALPGAGRITLDDLADWHARMEIVSHFG